MKTKHFSVLVSLIVLAITISSCKNPLNVPISQELPTNVYNEMCKEDTVLVSFMSRFNEFHIWVIKDEGALNKYGQITYSEIYEYEKYKSTIDKSAICNEYYKKHPEYPAYKHAADSILNQYNVTKPEDAVSVRLIGKETKYDWLNDRSPVFVFEVESHIGRIEQLVVSYSIQNKIYSTGKFKYDDCGSFHIEKPFSGKTIVKDPCYALGSTMLYATFKDLSYDDICANYETFIEISDYQVNGQVYRKLPYEIRAYYENKGTSLESWYFDDIIKKYVDPNFITLHEYRDAIMSDKLQKHNKQVHQMYNAYFSFEYIEP